MKQDFLVEIHTEEFPPKILLKIGKAFAEEVKARLHKAELHFADIKYFATPCRLAVLVEDLDAAQKDQIVEKRGPAKDAAFDAKGNPTSACIGFARSCGVTPEDLITIKNHQGEWVGCKQHVPGKNVTELLPLIIDQALLALPLPKRMRWGASDAQFVRPVHSVIMLYGDQIIDAVILGCRTGRTTRGHRFMAKDAIVIPTADAYESLLETEGYIIPNFEKRRAKIFAEASAVTRKKLANDYGVIPNDDLLNEVTGLVEYPVALCGQFDKGFLQLPEEVLISSMEDHQRYFPVIDGKKLQPYFVVISNIQSHDPERVIHGNERVLRARLSDAAFFYEVDQKESLEQRIKRLKGMTFQAKLGTLYDKVERLSKLAPFVLQEMQGTNQKAAERAGWLAKSDLTTQMVGEFPELQGVMGEYYALRDGEEKEVAYALREQYLPRFADDVLPIHPLGQALGLADRIDTLVGAFGIKQIPTGDKDPFGLRRAAIGILRILLEGEIDLDLKKLFELALSNYSVKLENVETIPQLLDFMKERLRSWYQDKGIAADVFASVEKYAARPVDMEKRIKAVQAFKKLSEAESLSVANKRVKNILANYVYDGKDIDQKIFEHPAEGVLEQQLKEKTKKVARLYQLKSYDDVLLELATLRKPIDDFFDHVMVMTDDQAKRENRLRMLYQLRELFSQVADIALLQ